MSSRCNSYALEVTQVSYSSEFAPVHVLNVLQYIEYLLTYSICVETLYIYTVRFTYYVSMYLPSLPSLLEREAKEDVSSSLMNHVSHENHKASSDSEPLRLRV